MRRKGSFRLILKDDDENSFEDVVQLLREVCHLNTHQCVQCSVLAHEMGWSSVKEGTKKDLTQMANSLSVMGLNVSVEKKPKFS